MKATIIVIIVVLLAAAGVWYFFSGNDAGTSTNTNTTNQVSNANSDPSVNAANENTNTGNENTNTGESAPVELTDSKIDMSGKVFLKGYKTPSESFGILTDDGQEIGLGSYDQEKEQFRPSIGERVSVTYSKICKSNKPDCCRSLFTYCGIVEDWEEIQ